MRILIVEDDYAVRTVLKNLFANHEVTTVTTLAGALKHVAEYKPHLVLLDCMLDDTKSPQETVDSIPKMAETSPETAVLLYTGYGSEEIKSKAIQHGAVGLIKKGSVWRISELATEIRSILLTSRFSPLIKELEDVLKVKL